MIIPLPAAVIASLHRPKNRCMASIPRHRERLLGRLEERPQKAGNGRIGGNAPEESSLKDRWPSGDPGPRAMDIVGAV